MRRRQLVIDTETTSLIPDYPTGRGVIWELAFIERDTGAEHLYRMKPDLAAADPSALAVGRFYERTRDMCGRCERPKRAYDLADLAEARDPHWSSPEALAADLAPMLSGVTIIGAVPSFDAGFLAAFLRHHGHAPTWHYRIRDIGSMAYGWTRQRGLLPSAVPLMDAGTDDFAVALGVDPGQFERHSALGDCYLVAAMLSVIEGTAVNGHG